MNTPSVTFYVPDDYPDYLLEMFSRDILDQVPNDTMVEIKRFHDQVEEIKQGLQDVSRQLTIPFTNEPITGVPVCTINNELVCIEPRSTVKDSN